MDDFCVSDATRLDSRQSCRRWSVPRQRRQGTSPCTGTMDAAPNPLQQKAKPDARIAEMMKTEKKPVRWKRFAPWFRNASCPSRTCSLPAAPRRRASWPCPDSTPSPRDGCSPARPRQAAELDQRQEPQAIPDRKGQKLGGVQPIHQARRCAPSLGGASSPLGACAPGAFSLEIDPTELDRELGGLEVTQARGLQACDVGLFATAQLSHVFSYADIVPQRLPH